MGAFHIYRLFFISAFLTMTCLCHRNHDKVTQRRFILWSVSST